MYAMKNGKQKRDGFKARESWNHKKYNEYFDLYFASYFIECKNYRVFTPSDND